jgi:hypothetical protein
MRVRGRDKMSKTKLDICTFSDGCTTTDIVAPKSKYPTKEDFIRECAAEEYDNGCSYSDKVKLENVTESYCRYFPKGIEDGDFPDGCYSFCKAGVGAFPIWRIEIC